MTVRGLVIARSEATKQSSSLQISESPCASPRPSDSLGSESAATYHELRKRTLEAQDALRIAVAYLGAHRIADWRGFDEICGGLRVLVRVIH